MPLSYCATHTAPSPTAMYAGEIPTLTGVPATEFVDGSSSTNVAGRLWSGSYGVGEVEPVAVSAQTSFSPAAVWTTRASGISATTAFVAASIRSTPVHVGAHRLLSKAAPGLPRFGDIRVLACGGIYR